MREPDGPAELVIEQPQLVLLRHPGTEGEAVSAHDVVTDPSQAAALSTGSWPEIWPPTIRQSRRQYTIYRPLGGEINTKTRITGSFR